MCLKDYYTTSSHYVYDLTVTCICITPICQVLNTHATPAAPISTAAPKALTQPLPRPRMLIRKASSMDELHTLPALQSESDPILYTFSLHMLDRTRNIELNNCFSFMIILLVSSIHPFYRARTRKAYQDETARTA